MRTRHLTLILPIVALLFVGSGCEESPIVSRILDLMEKPQDAVKHAVPPSTDDKDKDALVETFNMVDNAKIASDLEAEANDALAGKYPDTRKAAEKLQSALGFRPNDWALKNRLAVVQAEEGTGTDVKNSFGESTLNGACNQDRMKEDAFHRCWSALQRDRSRLLDESVARQKQNGGLVRCATYDAIARHYDYLSRVTDGGFTETMMDDFGDRVTKAEAMQKRPGDTCEI